ncbi:MAG: hypothetical protein ACLTJB_00055 [Holdemania filiformis]
MRVDQPGMTILPLASEFLPQASLATSMILPSLISTSACSRTPATHRQDLPFL